MSKNRNAVTCNGRAAFYACMWNDIRQCAMDSGWAVALHGSLTSDMDIMAMPWVEEADTFECLIDKISKLFPDNDLSSQYVIAYDEKPHQRVVATIPIFSDFYLDISTIPSDSVLKRGRLYHEPELRHALKVIRGECGKQDGCNRFCQLYNPDYELGNGERPCLLMYRVPKEYNIEAWEKENKI